MFRIVIQLLICVIIVSGSHAQQRVIEVDVCIYGGTAPGIIAGYTASKLGKSVVVIEPTNHIGGRILSASTDIADKAVITGLARDFYRRVGRHYNKFEQWTYEPHVAQQVMEEYVAQSNINLLINTSLAEVTRESRALVYVNLRDNITGDLIQVRARMFIDCSYEGDLMAKAGIPFSVGEVDHSTATREVFPDIKTFYVEGGKKKLLPGISYLSDSLKYLRAYGFEPCLTSEPARRVDITRPDSYDSTRYELLARLIAAQPEKLRLSDYFQITKLPGGKKAIFRAKGLFSLDYVGGNLDYVEHEDRSPYLDAHQAYAQGLFYFLASDLRVPFELRRQMQMWGYAKDEYQDNNYWPYQLAITESRRLNGMTTFGSQHLKAPSRTSIGSFTGKTAKDICTRVFENQKIVNVTHATGNLPKQFSIPLGSLVPLEEQAVNFLSPVCISATHEAFGMINSEPYFMMLAQAAATTAVTAINEGVPVQAVAERKIADQLRQFPLADSSKFEFLVDNNNSRHTIQTGKLWEKQNGGYAKSFLIIDNSKNDKASRSRKAQMHTFRFNGPAKNPGEYDVYIYLPKVKDCADMITVRISNGMFVKERVIHSDKAAIQDDCDGEWISLGKHKIEKGKHPFVEIINTTTTGKVVADAVIWVASSDSVKI